MLRRFHSSSSSSSSILLSKIIHPFLLSSSSLALQHSSSSSAMSEDVSHQNNSLSSDPSSSSLPTNAAAGHPGQRWISDPESLSPKEGAAALNTLLSVSDSKDWQSISRRFIDQRSRRCILCQENIPETGQAAHCHSPMHQSREGIALEMLRRNRGTPAEVVARWWHLLEDGFPVKFYKIPRLSVDAPGMADVSSEDEQFEKELWKSLFQTGQSLSMMDGGGGFGDGGDKSEKRFRLQRSERNNNTSTMKKNKDKNNKKTSSNYFIPRPRRRRSLSLEHGVTDVDILDLEESLERRRLRLHYVLRFLRDAGVLRDCFGSTFDDKNRKMMGRSFHFERLEWVGDNAGKFTVNDRVSAIFPGSEGGARGRLGMLSCLMDSNEGLTRGYDNLKIDELLPHLEDTSMQKDSCSISSMVHVNTNETRGKMKADIMEAMRGELWTFCRSGLISFDVGNMAACSPFLQGSALGFAGFDAPTSNGMYMVRKLAEHAMNEIDTLFLLYHLVQICRWVTQLVKNDLKLTIERHLSHPFMPIRFDPDNFRVTQVSKEQWKRDYYLSCLEVDYPEHFRDSNELSLLRKKQQEGGGIGGSGQLSASQKRKLKKRTKKQQEAEEKRYKLAVTDEKKPLPDHFFQKNYKQEQSSSLSSEGSNTDRHEGLEEDGSSVNNNKSSSTVSSSSPLAFVPALSPRLYSMPRGGFTSYRRREPPTDIQVITTVNNNNINNNLDEDNNVVDDSTSSSPKQQHKVLSSLIKNIEESSGEQFDFDAHQIIRKADKEALPWLSKIRQEGGSTDGCSGVVLDSLFESFTTREKETEDGREAENFVSEFVKVHYKLD